MTSMMNYAKRDDLICQSKDGKPDCQCATVWWTCRLPNKRVNSLRKRALLQNRRRRLRVLS